MNRIAIPLAVLLAVAAYAENPRQVRLSTLDDVIPQVVSGFGWSTSIVLVNMEDQAVYASVKFYAENGQEWVGTGLPSKVNIASRGTFTMQTEESGGLRQGWAQIDVPCCAKVGGYAIFRQRVGTRPDFEAVVPFSSSYSSRSVLAFDNRNGFSTGIAIVNPSEYTNATVTIAIRNEAGDRVVLDQFNMPKRTKQVFSLSDRFAASAGQHGTIEFTSSPGQISVLGLRFNPTGAFTSIHALEP